MRKTSRRWSGSPPCAPMSRTRGSRRSDIMVITAMSAGESGGSIYSHHNQSRHITIRKVAWRSCTGYSTNSSLSKDIKVHQSFSQKFGYLANIPKFPFIQEPAICLTDEDTHIFGPEVNALTGRKDILTEDAFAGLDRPELALTVLRERTPSPFPSPPVGASSRLRSIAARRPLLQERGRWRGVRISIWVPAVCGLLL